MEDFDISRLKNWVDRRRKEIQDAADFYEAVTFISEYEGRINTLKRQVESLEANRRKNEEVEAINTDVIKAKAGYDEALRVYRDQHDQEVAQCKQILLNMQKENQNYRYQIDAEKNTLENARDLLVKQVEILKKEKTELQASIDMIKQTVSQLTEGF